MGHKSSIKGHESPINPIVNEAFVQNVNTEIAQIV